MQNLIVNLVQADLAWEDKTKNYTHLYNLATQAPKADVVLLPEMFATGFSMNAAKLAEPPEGPTLHFMQKLAVELNAAVAGSAIIAEDNRFYNRLFWVEPNGQVYSYNKRHLFSLAGEEKVYTTGNERFVIEYKGWRLMPQICYDLRFPVWCRNDLGYDAVLFLANWPERRSYPWQQLLIARAIENQAYVLGVNRVGQDGNGINHSGNSAAVNPLGEVVHTLPNHAEGVITAQLHRDEITDTRTKFGFLADRDDFNIDTA